MDSQSEIYEGQPRKPEDVINEFVTRVWEHPLIDEQTRRHRIEARNRLEKLLVKHNVDKSIFVTIPIGSLVWVTDNESDFDYLLVIDTKENHKCFVFENSQIKNIYKESKKQGIDFYSRKTWLSDFINYGYNYVSLLFTPDEYIGGNVDLARQIRREVVEMLQRKNDTALFKGAIRDRFDAIFRNWDDITSFYAQKLREKKTGDRRGRSTRIQERLEKRALQTKRPERYIETFKRARTSLPFPDFDTYAQAIKNTNGALSLDSRFIARGIER